MRSLTLLVPLLALSLGTLACEVGAVDPNTESDGGNTADASGGDDDGSAATCDEPKTAVSGNHHQGEDCMRCHIEGGEEPGAPIYTIAGTLYGDFAGTTGVSGATIHIIDANGVEIELVTGLDGPLDPENEPDELGAGNFWSTQAVAFPVTTRASLCPNTDMAMIAPAAIGSCNSAGCHADGSPNGRIHIP